MQAIVVHRYGGPEQLILEDVPTPTPGAGDVLVRLVAAGVGPCDALVRAGKTSLPETLPLIPGSEIAGTVASANVRGDHFAAGDEVFGATNPLFINGYAEYALTSADMIAQKPKFLDFVGAAHKAANRENSLKIRTDCRLFNTHVEWYAMAKSAHRRSAPRCVKLEEKPNAQVALPRHRISKIPQPSSNSSWRSQEAQEYEFLRN